MDIIEVDIQNLKDAYTNIVEAMNNIVDIEELIDDYKILDQIAEKIVKIQVDKEAKLEELEEEKFFQEQKEQWEKEQKELENEYWRSQF